MMPPKGGDDSGKPDCVPIRRISPSPSFGGICFDGMKPLPQRFSKSKFYFTVTKRVGDVVLLTKKHIETGAIGYEVCIVQKHAERVIGGVTIPATEALPSSEQWGFKGWTPFDFDQAMRTFQRVVEMQKAKASE